jgi:4-hydroxy-tetrahydrodipicolinate synthase
MQDFAGVWVPLVTPFDRDAIDHEGLRRLVRSLATSGIAGVVVCGSTGEAAALDESEQHAVLRTVLEAGPGLRVILGVSGVTPRSVATRLAGLHGLALSGVLVPPPSYVRPSQQGIADFFATVADASPCPLVLYDIPARTGVRIATETMLALARHPTIRAVKDCSADPDHVQAIVDDGRLQLLAGDDHRMFATLCQGGVGAIAASAHLRPDLFVRLHRSIQRGELHAARRLWQVLWPLTTALFDEPNPGPVKAALALRHGLRNELRAPMTCATPGTVQRVADALRKLADEWPERLAP